MSGDRNEKKVSEEREDPRLKNWSSWLKEWHSVGGVLSERLNVHSENLLMHYGDDVRKINLEKSLLQYVKIPTEFDKYRGNPDFWNLPCSLTKKFRCLTEPKYFAVKSKEERNEVPGIAFIANPDYVTTREKNIIDGARNIYERWQNSKYRRTQLEKFAPKIDFLVPHVPHVSNLIVLGRHFGAVEDENQAPRLEDPPPSPALGKKRDVEIKERHSAPSLQPPLEHSHRQRLLLVVNGIRLDVNACKDSTCRKLRVYFEFDVSKKVANVKYLFFSNNGSATLTLSWKRIEKFQLFRNCMRAQTESYFYFDKNDLVLLPGARTEVPVWFKSEIAGTFSESWELVSKPEIWSSRFRLIVLFHSYAYFGDLKLKVDNLVKYMDVQLRNRLIRELLNEIVCKLRYEETPVVSCVYDESHLFEIANLSNGRPFFLFDEVIVDELKALFEKLKTGAQHWNYSVKHLEKLAQSKDVAVFLENKKTEFAELIAEKIKNEEAERLAALKTPKSEPGKKAKAKKGKKEKKGKSLKSDKKSKSSKKSKKTEEPKVEEEPEVEIFKKENYIYTNQLELWNVVKKLESPVVINTNREKYFSCTKVISAYFSKMCHMLESLEHEYEIIRTSKFPDTKYSLVPDLPERLVYEYYEDDYLSKKVFETYPLGAKRKPKILRDIPSDDIETIYRTYFNVPLERKEPEKKGKGKKKAGKEKSPKKQKGDKQSKKGGKKGDKGSKKGKIVELKPEISVESFNPYAEQFVYVGESEQAETASLLEDEIPLTEIMKEDYKYKQYITVYTCLSEAVDALVDTLQSFDCVVSHSTLNEMKSSFPDSFEEKPAEQD